MMMQTNETSATAKNANKSRFLRRATEAVWPFGAFQKTNDPHSAIESLERASGAATLWILGGIVIDIFALVLFGHDLPERAVGIIANAAIGFGLVVEYLVIGRVIDATKEAERESNERTAKIEERAAEANARASDAQLALARLKSPRMFAQEDRARVIALVKQFKGQQYCGLVASGVPDARKLWAGIDATLAGAGWIRVNFNGLVVGDPPAGVPVSPNEGITVYTPVANQTAPVDPNLAHPVLALVQGLNLSGLAAQAGKVVADPINSTAITIEVGTKPQ